jgi:molybdenum cofactor synthesis domain-containing protein
VRPLRHTIPFAEASRLALLAVSPIDRTERVALADGGGRVLAEALFAAGDVPPFSRAAMDGFAVRAEDTLGASAATPKTLRCVDVIFTGEAPQRTLAAGECAEIATGAPVPEGSDAVVMVEETDRADGSSRRDSVSIRMAVRPGQNVTPRANDIKAGERLLGPGDLLTPSRLGVCAAAGRSHVDVYAHPVVAMVSTGGEIVEPGQPLGPAQIYDINRYTLAAAVSMHGGVARVLPPAPDNLEALTETLVEGTRSADIFVFSGGSSVGERDLVLDAMRQAGEVIFHGIAVKPGKPTALGRVNGRPVLGMPGNPTSCLSNAYLLLVPMLRRTARLPDTEPRIERVPLSTRIVSTAGRHQFYTVRLEGGTAVPVFKSSGDITSMSRADGYIEIAADQSVVEEGQLIDVKLF